MKPVATCSVTMKVGIVCSLLFAVIASVAAQDALKKEIVPHQSLAAYPQAIISLKDPKMGMLFYVESNGRRLVAFDKDGAVAWSADVLGEAKIKPVHGEPVIRSLRLQEGELRVTCGKSDEAKVDIKTGKTEYVGAD